MHLSHLSSVRAYPDSEGAELSRRLVPFRCEQTLKQAKNPPRLFQNSQES